MKPHPGISFFVALLLGLSVAHSAPPDLLPPAEAAVPGTVKTTNPEPPAAAKGSSDQALTGDWGGLRSRLEDRGIKLSAQYIGEVFGNSGGADQAVVTNGLFNLGLDLDLEKLTGFWKDATLHANALYLYGPNISARYIGDFGTVSNIAGYNSLRLQEAYLDQNFWDKRFSLRVGMLAADSEFFLSDSSGLFINGTFGAFTLIASNFTNAPIYPVSSPGLRFSFQPVSKFYVRGAVFGMDSSADPAGNNANGTHFHINDSDGALFMWELGYLHNQAPNDRGLVGSYKLGGFAQRGNYPSFESQANDALGLGRLSGKGTNYAFYAIGDQEIYKGGGKTVTAFVRGGFASSRLSFVDGYLDAGFNFTGFIPGRDDDIAGLAFAYSHVSDDFSNANVRQGNPASSYEAVLEATYKVNLAPWWTIQPDLQYIFNPSGVKHSTDAFVLGVRTTVTF